MLQYFVDFLKISLPILYLFTIFLYGLAFFLDEQFGIRNRTRFLIGTLVVHFIYIIGHTLLTEHPPVTSVFEIMTVVSFTIGVAYVYIETRSRVKDTGMFILALAFLFEVVSAAFMRDYVQLKPVLKSSVLGLHVASAMLGYSALAISAVYGGLYLMMYHEIRSSKFGIIYRKLPDLQTLEKLSYRSIFLGFIFLSIVILIGYVWLPKTIDDFSYSDPKLVITDFVWIIYFAALLFRRVMRWTGRTVMIVSMVGFVLTVASLVVVNVMHSFHNFR
ncbi:MAG TPA: cytochrome c biogenesis protein CcsA [Candidatus Acidoferrales bacterium]|nr:cytochrome c biogenesis protein CcsA [Candidatus Acidoferrales bacterium]